MRVQGLLNICRQNILSAERDQISRVVEKIKSASLKGCTRVYDDILNEKTISFLENQNFKVAKEDYLYMIDWDYTKDKERKGSLFKEAVNNVRIQKRDKVISTIKYETYSGNRSFFYPSDIDEDVKNELEHEGFLIEKKDYEYLISVPNEKD